MDRNTEDFNLSHSNVSGIDFSHSNFKNINLSSSKLSGCIFDDVSFEDIDLSFPTCATLSLNKYDQ
ncbi:MAG: pentapeptide repeat-containing protein [Chloroflexia bacterium]|nr:pentapeptide repeat-containing protein [Chloroflexia bacterium]